MADTDSMTPSAAEDQRPFGLVGTEPGDAVGGYELLRELGRGGMAEVWLARRTRAGSGKFVAIKMILPQYVGIERYSRMFASEAEVAAPLSHSNIAQVFDEGEERGRSYLVMEWVDGADLSQLLPNFAELRRRDPYLRLRIAAYIVGQVLHGLSYAHKITSHRGRNLGIVHRDISPQNVLVSVSGDVKITDFGIAHRMIEETSGINVKGKLRYMAPEHLGGSSHSPSVDLYAVGAILHELLDGAKFRSDADDQVALYHQVMSGRVPALVSTDVPAELDAVRRALLDPDPAQRPQTADAVVLMLKRWSGYSEMRVELGMLCGLATGVVRPRTGPIVAPGMPTVPPRAAARALPFAAPVLAEPDAPAAPWGVLPSSQASRADAGAGGTSVLAEHELHASGRPRSEPTVDFAATTGVARGSMSSPLAAAPSFDRRDLDPTHSSVESYAYPSASAPVVEATASDYDLLASRESARVAPWQWIAAAAGLAVLGALGTAWLLVHRREPAATLVVATQDDAPVLREAATPTLDAAQDVIDQPDLSASSAADPPTPPAAIVEPEPMPIPAAPAPSVAPTRREPIASTRREPPKPAAKRPSAPASPTGPQVTVHFRLEGGLTAAELKLGTRVIILRAGFDARIASGRYTAKFRLTAAERWRPAGTVEIGPSGEWKLLLGPSGARVVEM
jgi:Protein kinase domain